MPSTIRGVRDASIAREKIEGSRHIVNGERLEKIITTVGGSAVLGGDLSGTVADAEIVAGAVGTTELADNAATDAKLGNRTADDTTSHASATGTLTQLLSLLAKLLKAVTGKSSFLTAPATTLEAASTHYGTKASASTLGHVKVDGSTITADTDGIISASLDTSNLAYMRTADGSVPGGNTVANTTSETTFSTISTFPAGTLTTGDVVRVRLFGVFSTAGSTPSMTLKIKFGGTTLISTGGVNLTSSATSYGWSLEMAGIVQTSGGSGTIESQGLLHLDTSGSGLTKHTPNTSTISIATNVDANLTVTAQWSAASTSNTITLRQLMVEHIRI